jgi:predicted ATP-grasp superfamily ATP-dependent carboligase
MQRWIHGSDPDHYTCDCYLRADGEPLVTFSTRKLRQWPPEVGQGCISVEHRNDVVRELALRVLKAAGYHGLGYVEMKYDAREERHFIVEANVGRPTGRSAAAEKAGVELLMTMYCDVIGAPLPTARTQRFRGSKWIHVRRDLQACSRLLVTRRARPGEILRSWSGSFAFALFSLRDPRPFLADMTRGMGRALRFRRASRGADGSLPGVFARTGVRGAPEVRPPPRDRSRIAPAAPTGAPPASIDERNAPPDEPASVPSHRIRETG